ncbi:MAG: hypothetical protein IJX89_01565 [Alphaproteobacteria bacterium]|nr:hypothetical protein [Alphaproteobacteria bacterium]
MKKILIFAANLLLCAGVAGAAVRDGTAVSRNKSDTASQSRISTTVRSRTARTSTALSPRVNATADTSSSRAITTRATANNNAKRTNTASVSSRAVATKNARTISQTVAVRAATDTNTTTTETRTGAAYEQCKNAYFTCMDQFCALKNDDYRRCSCTDRVYELGELRDVLTDAGEQLTVFTENLDVVGMTAAQATAMKTASDGENALTSDKSASKALLQAIMNTIRGEDSTVGGKYSDLNSINISFDTVNAFGMADSGQVIASYNGKALYSAVYPSCRSAVRADCNDASLQRAVTAYLMAMEQDCNTVQTAIENKQKEMKAAVREGSAMLDLARIENRQKHNSSDIPTCINAVAAAIQSEEVCGPGYYKCLDNGEYIDISTGKAITGVEDFYKLEKLLTFSDGVEAADQKLSKNSSNRTFVQNFENRTKKFAADALDTCTENADTVWSEYLDQALLDIYYAQKAKVAEIKQGCFDFVASCYMDSDTAITAAMAELTGDAGVILQPDKVALNTQMCKEYVNSCNNMFDGDIIKDYVDNRQGTDTLTACRAVVKQCFDKYGGTNYENFYYPYSGLFTAHNGTAPDWFTLYDCTSCDCSVDNHACPYKSECASQLTDIEACSDRKMIEQAFGGFDKMYTEKTNTTNDTNYSVKSKDENDTVYRYGLLVDGGASMGHRKLRPTGVATELYNQVVDILTTQCTNLQGRFMEFQFVKTNLYGNADMVASEESNNICLANFSDRNNSYSQIEDLYGIKANENMCPRDYVLGVDTQSWGACICWENGARRSKDGKSAKCIAGLPTMTAAKDAYCETGNNGGWFEIDEASDNEDNWCTRSSAGMSKLNQVCPNGYNFNEESDYCYKSETKEVLDQLPEGL